MYIIEKGEKYYIDRAYWLGSQGLTVYEFKNDKGDLYSIDVEPDECLEAYGLEYDNEEEGEE